MANRVNHELTVDVFKLHFMQKVRSGSRSGAQQILGRLMSSVWNFSAQIADASLGGLGRNPM